jgi:hypothetical protein
MESNYRNRDFEQYVKQNADQYRMFPSEKVWKNIHGTLHTRRKWYGFGLALLLLSTVSAVTWVMVSNPASDNKKSAAITPAPGQTPGLQTASARPSAPEISATDLPFSNKPAVAAGNSPLFDFVSANQPSITEDADKLNELLAEQNADNNSEKGQFTATITVPKISSAINSNTTTVPVSETVEPASGGINDFSVNDPAGKPVTGLTTAPSTQQEYGYPLTIESVTNTYRGRVRNKIDWQIYVTPTVSYRKLAVNKSLESITTTIYPYALANMADINDVVTHKPDMGVQVGLSGGYPITKNLKVRAGFQFNITRYDIKASLNNPVQASYDLNGDNGGIDPVRTWTYYRNYNGNKSDWLKNYYFSVSFPIGVELKLLGGQKTNFGVAGTIQPTYTIKERAYMISTDLKNYATIPWLMRDVNVSTGFEMFVNYTSGKTRWQVGPQVRYQILSSFHNKYPVKENLFDFGVKVGVSLNQ